MDEGIIVSTPSYICPTHGETSLAMTVVVDEKEQRRDTYDGHYCVLCMIDRLKDSGIFPMEKVK